MMIYDIPPFAVVGCKSLGVSEPKDLEGPALGQLAETYEFQNAPDASLYFTNAYLPAADARKLQ